jgi:hypothetical protein
MVLQNEIRILHILPHNGDSEAPIKCDIQVASLEDKPEYEALSYVWGDKLALVEIEVSDSKVGVTKNLYAALRRLRLANEARRLWVDQLCINQWDMKEKEQQVRLMRHIYSQCRQCNLWMGELQEGVTESDAHGAIDILTYMEKVAGAGSEEGIAVPQCFETAYHFTGPSKALESLAIDRNPWWARVWTVQEAVLPPNKIMLWGPLTMPWETMTNAANCWTSYIPPLLAERIRDVWNTGIMGGLMAMVVWLQISTQRMDSPVFLVNRWRFREATDPRDKIYALMGLCESGSMPFMESCNYEMSVVDVFSNLTADLMRSEEDLFPLIMDPRLEIGKATPGLPRWALDVSYISEWNTDWFHLYAWPWYNAHGERPLDLDRVFSRWEESRSILELEGVFVNAIEIVGEPSLYSRESRAEELQSRLKKLRSWELLAKEHIKRGTPESSELYPGGYTLREAFGRLMLGDLMRDDEQWVDAPANEEDVESVYQSVDEGNAYCTIRGMMNNQRFFITKTGLMGIGHMDTQPGEEVWVFHGGNFPFTLIPREGNSGNNYDFGGRCYVQGIMNGEAFERGQNTRMTAIY